MAASPFLLLLLLLPLSSCLALAAAEQQPRYHFLQCLNSESSASISHLVYTQTNPSYSSVLQFSIRNPRFNTTSTAKPVLVITPKSISHIQATIECSRKHNLQLRIRSGGHDYEEITVDVASKTAWVQAGATLGELYYAISQKSTTLAFPGGICPTVGIGGYVSGGADNVVDAIFVDANGRTLDRHSMGEDMFWAVRGGGGNSFGVAVAWKVNLVTVPEKLTVFRVSRTLEQNATKLVHQWQTVANELPEDIIIMATIQKVNTTIQATFNSMYLGRIDGVLQLIRTAKYKGKSDYVQRPISEIGWEGVWKKLDELGPMAGALAMIPYGGKMEEIPEWSLPFPHRAGNLFMIQYDVFWNEDGIEASERNVNWIREVYSYMTPFVSKNPRAAYMNYRDLDIGMNDIDGGKGRGYEEEEARVWGLKYFKNNWDRLVEVKTAVDPDDFFRNEQSIPPLAQ
ncbi:Berberine bridge enzyme-like 18 [Linum grandiflorum]